VSLADLGVSGFPVVDSQRRLLGVISSTDLIAAQAETRSDDERQELLERTTVREIMTPTAFTIAANARLRDAAQHMLYGDVRRLFVEEDGVLVGVISQTDIVQAVATGKPL
jgi:CBS domain-containing protein